MLPNNFMVDDRVSAGVGDGEISGSSKMGQVQLPRLAVVVSALRSRPSSCWSVPCSPPFFTQSIQTRPLSPAKAYTFSSRLYLLLPPDRATTLYSAVDALSSSLRYPKPSSFISRLHFHRYNIAYDLLDRLSQPTVSRWSGSSICALIFSETGSISQDGLQPDLHPPALHGQAVWQQLRQQLAHVTQWRGEAKVH